jgi:hypothetical protein
MSLQSTMMKAAALYALKRASENVSEDDMKRWAKQAIDRTPEEWRSGALNTLDAGLMRAGLMRASQAPNTASLVMTGMIAGVVVGAGAALLLAPMTGTEMREKIGSLFSRSKKDETEDAEMASEEDSDGSPKTVGGTRVPTN